ncbi:MAG TPA: hypothetical protein VJS20_00775 [Gemmatimonadales bacterium]|nr:hypothetical protein [Gemmatimonadales bacterium]
MVHPKGKWTVADLMDELFGPAKLACLSTEITEARKRADFLREVPDAREVQSQLSRLSREIVREADGRHLAEEGDFASALAQVTRQAEWDEPAIDRLAAGFSRLDRMVQVRMERLSRLMLAGRNVGETQVS